MTEPVDVHAVSPTAVFLIAVAVLVGLLGLLFSSQASLGASLVAFACLLGIWARIAQAAWHHRDLMKR